MGASCCNGAGPEPQDVGELEEVLKMREFMVSLREFSLNPEVVQAKDKSNVRVRSCTLQDLAAFKEHVLDKAGTGAGHGGDPIVINSFKNFLQDEDMILLWVEEADPPHKALGMTAMTFPTPYESFFHTLRVSAHARCKGIAEILFKASCRICVQLQGERSIGRWGVVSSNEIMMGWSSRKKLQGPAKTTRYEAPPAEKPNVLGALPPGWTCKDPTPADVGPIMRHVTFKEGAFEDYGEEHTTVNFLKYGSMCEVNEEVFYRCIRRHKWLPVDNAAPELGIAPYYGCAPLIFDEKGNLAAVALYSVCVHPVFPEKGPLMTFNYMGGTRKGIQVVLEVLRHVAGRDNCCLVLGFVPDLDWLTEDLAKSESFKRGSKTHEMVFTWRNKQFVP